MRHWEEHIPVSDSFLAQMKLNISTFTLEMGEYTNTDMVHVLFS